MIALREIKATDAPLMLEWMHDPTIQKAFKRNMMAMTLTDVQNFCESAKLPEKLVDGQSVHFAIVDENDEYLGTISLKDIDQRNKEAEYAISTRRKAHGKGIGTVATGLVLKKAFYDYGLHRVFLNVLAENKTAIHLYERCGFTYEGEFRDHLSIEGKYENLKWYGMLENEFNENNFWGE